jgi:threonine dehydratase
MPLAFSNILAARKRIGAHVLRTQQRPSAALGRLAGHEVLLKCEHQQTTGRFKLRGATNAVLALDEAQRRRGICAASTGNHGRAIAHASRAAGARAVICMSRLVPANKVEAVRALGAEVRIVGDSQDDAQKEVDRLVDHDGLVAISPFDHPDVIAGQGTIGLEVLEDEPGLDAVLVPLSGGGLISGIALAIKTMKPEAQVIGVTMEHGAAMAASLRAGKPVEVEEVATLADSLGGGIGLDNRHTFEIVRRHVDRTILVSEREIAEAIRFAYFKEAEVIEGAAAVGIAAVISGKFRPAGKTVLVLSGRNIAMETHARIVNDTHPAFGGES